MYRIKNQQLFKTARIILIATFICLDITYAHPPQQSVQSSTLAIPSVLRQRPVSERAEHKQTHSTLSESISTDNIATFIRSIDSDIEIAKVEQVAGPIRQVNNLWSSPQAIVALRQLVAAVHGAASLYMSGLAGKGADLSGTDLNVLKRQLDSIVTDELLEMAKGCHICIRVRAGEGQVPKKGDEGQQPGLYMDEKYGGIPGAKEEIVVDIAVDPLDGTTSLAKGAENVSEPPTVLLAVYKAKHSVVFTKDTEILKEVPDCFAVMGHRLSPRRAELFNAGKMWDGENFNMGAIEMYLNAQAAEKIAKELSKSIEELSDSEIEEAKKKLRIVIHKREKNPELVKFLRSKGFINISTPNDILEQLYVVPSSIMNESVVFKHSMGAVDVMISHYLGSAETAMVAATLGALGRDMDLSFTVDGENGQTKFNDKTVWGIDDVMDRNSPAFQIIVAARDAQGYLKLHGPLMTSQNRTEIEALLVAADGAVYKIALSLPVIEKELGRWGFQVFTETARSAGDPAYNEATQTYNLHGTACYVIEEQERIEKAVGALQAAVAHPAQRKVSLGEYGRSIRESFNGLNEDFRNSDPLTTILCEYANSIPATIGARHIGAGWGGMAAVWVGEGDVSSAMEKINEFLGSEKYRIALAKKGIPTEEIDKTIEETRRGIRLAVPGPAASVVLTGAANNLIKELQDIESVICQKLMAIYGTVKTQFHGRDMPRWEKARQRYFTFLKEFDQRYPEAGEVVIARCGSKICVTGEHSDAHHGRSVVAPLLDDTLVAIAVSNKYSSVKMAAMGNDFPDAEYNPSTLEIKKVTQEKLRGSEWFRYLAYNIHFLRQRIAKTEKIEPEPPSGLCVLVDGREEYGAIPVSAGLGSSAALNVATAEAFLGLTGKRLNATQIAMNVQEAEIATGMFTGLDDSFAMMGGGLQGDNDKIYAVDMDFVPREDAEGQPLLKVKLAEMPKGLVAILINTGPRNPCVQLEYGLRIDESMMAAYIFSHMLQEKFPAFFSQFDNPEAIDKWLDEKYTDQATNSKIKSKNAGTYPWFLRLYYLSLAELQRVGLNISSGELNVLIDALPDRAKKADLERLLGRYLWNDLMRLGGSTPANIKKLTDRLASGMEKDLPSLQLEIPQPPGKPAILGGVPVFSEKIDIIKPTKPTNKGIVTRAVSGIINKGRYVGFDYKRRFEEAVAKQLRLEGRKVVAVTSGTDALILLLRGSEVGVDGRDEVIVPSFTFHATVQAILRCGLKPVFADIDPETLTMDPKKVEALINEKTGAIIPVDIFGNPSAYDEFEHIATQHKLKLLFDSAGSLGSTYKGKPIGNFGNGAAISFSFGKIVQAFGRGGVIIADQKMLDALNKDLRGDLRASMMPEINAVMGYDNMLSFEQHLANRQEAARIYASRLSNIPGLALQRYSSGATVSVTHFPIIIDKEVFGLSRDQLKWALEAEGIATKEYFPAQHREFKGYPKGDLSETERIADNILCLPVWSDMDPHTIEKVTQAIERICSNRLEIRELFQRRDRTLRSFVNLPDRLFTVERDLLFNRFYTLKAMLTGGLVVPPEVDIHPSNICTNRCRFCIGKIGATKTKVPNIMTKDEIHKILQDIVSYNNELEASGESGIQLVRFTGHDGEPLMSPATLAGMEEAMKLGLKTALVTNGVFLTDKARAVVVRAKYVYISLYGGSEESYRAITGNEKGFSAVIENVRQLVKLKREQGTDVNINVGFIIQPENYKEVLSIAKTLKEIGVSNIRFRIAMEDEENALSKEQLEECYGYMRQAQQQLSDNSFGVVMLYSEEEAHLVTKKDCKRCLGHPLIGVIGPNLSIYPCTHRSYSGAASFGNLRTSSFSEIWNGNRRRALMNKLVPSKSCPICPPQAGRVNDFLGYLSDENSADPTFLSWLENWAACETSDFLSAQRSVSQPPAEPRIIDITYLDLNNTAGIDSIRRDIEQSYQSVRPILKYPPASIQVQKVMMPCGVEARIGYVKNRPPYVEGEDSVSYNIRYKGVDYVLVFRGRPYTDFHIILATGEISQAETPHPDLLEVGLLMARILGGGSELFCNRVAPTSPNFHYQIIKSGHMTIWDADLSRWPAYVVEKKDQDPFRLAREISDRVQMFREEGAECDIFIKYDGTQYKSILIPRRVGDVFPSGQLGKKKDFSTIGSLEMAGYFMSCRNDESAALMTGNEGGALYENALRELSYRPLKVLNDNYAAEKTALSAV